MILNEAGEAASGAGIERPRDGSLFSEWVELHNGCLCCSAKDAGLEALEALLSRKNKEKKTSVFVFDMMK